MNTPNPVVLVIVLGALSLAPFVVIMMTSFVKISVSLSILRNALGTQQVPPIASDHGAVVRPDAFRDGAGGGADVQRSGDVREHRRHLLRGEREEFFDAADKGKEPLRKFLAGHAHPKDRTLFMELAARLDRRPRAERLRWCWRPRPSRQLQLRLRPRLRRRRSSARTIFVS